MLASVCDISKDASVVCGTQKCAWMALTLSTAPGKEEGHTATAVGNEKYPGEQRSGRIL